MRKKRGRRTRPGGLGKGGGKRKRVEERRGQGSGRRRWKEVLVEKAQGGKRRNMVEERKGKEGREMMAYDTCFVCHMTLPDLYYTHTFDERFVRFSYVPRSFCPVLARYSYGALAGNCAVNVRFTRSILRS